MNPPLRWGRRGRGARAPGDSPLEPHDLARRRWRAIPKALVAWSSGKDSAWALHEVRRAGALDVVGLLTTVTSEFARVSMHAGRERLLDQQAASVGLPCRKVEREGFVFADLLPAA